MKLKILTTISFVLSPGAVDLSITDVALRHAAPLSAVDGAAAAALAVELVRLVEAVHMSVTAPVGRDAALRVTLEPRWTHCGTKGDSFIL